MPSSNEVIFHEPSPFLSNPKITANFTPHVKISVISYNGPQWGNLFWKTKCKNQKHRVLDNKLKQFCEMFGRSKLNKNLATTRNILRVKDTVPCTVVPPCVKILVGISTPVLKLKSQFLVIFWANPRWSKDINILIDGCTQHYMTWEET